MSKLRRSWMLALSVAPAAALAMVLGLIPDLPIDINPSDEQPPGEFPRPGSPLFEDLGTEGDAAALWGALDCQRLNRQQLRAAGGDPSARADQSPQGNGDFRRLRVRDGDDVYGERCELGLNDHREGPTAVYREGERAITYLSLRLPPRFPLQARAWQVVMQMKQTQPADEGDGPPVLALHARNGRWRLVHNGASQSRSGPGQVWSAPARKGTWTRFAFDVFYSPDPERGWVVVSVDLDGNGRPDGPGEQSAVIPLQTLKVEGSGDSEDGIDSGEPIPSHLRVGLYHHSEIDCPGGCAIDVDNVGIYAPAP